MLSKSSAKAFFLIGTAVCAGAFIMLTVDSLAKIPTQTHQENLTESAIRGKHLWESNNCMGCHTLLGEGAYYAPELTKVFERRGPTFIKSMLTNPESMYPGQRKMVHYNFSEQDKDDLVEFLKWINNIDLNGFPAKPNIGQVVSAPQVNRPQIFTQMCLACHTLNGEGGNVGPALDGIGKRRDLVFIQNQLKDPTTNKQDAKMPKLPLSEADMTELSTFLSQLK